VSAERVDAGAIAREVAGAPDAYEPPLTDWTLRPFASGTSPFAVAAALALALVVTSQLVRIAVAGMPTGPLWRDPYLWLDLLNGVLFAYIPTALWLLRRGRLRDLRELRPHLREEISWRAVVDATLLVPQRRLLLAGSAGALVLGILPVIDPGFWEGTRPALTAPIMLFFVVRMAISGWLGGHAVVTETTALAALSRIGATQTRVDLMDLRPFEIFARAGLRSAFAWVLVSSLVSLFWLGPGAGSANAFIVGATLVSVSLGVFACIYGPHRAIAAAKREVLGGVEGRIARAGAALEAGRDPEDDGVRLADLVAWHALLLRVRDWPIGASALARAALLAALALGSWLGGVLVERAVDWLFG
jgi:hypothetical protein